MKTYTKKLSYIISGDGFLACVLYTYVRYANMEWDVVKATSNGVNKQQL